MRQVKSVVNSEFWVSEPTWVLSLVAKPQGKSPEHAILLVEGISSNNGAQQYTFRRYDFVKELSPAERATQTDVFNPKTLKRWPGKVVINIFDQRPFNAQLTEEENVGERSRFFWGEIMRDLFQAAGCKGMSWNISMEQAGKLHANVLASQKKPPPYQILGKDSVLPKSSDMSKCGMSGHNCYTWARDQALKLDDRRIATDLKTRLRDFLVAQTSCHLKSPVQQDESTSPSPGGCVIF